MLPFFLQTLVVSHSYVTSGREAEPVLSSPILAGGLPEIILAVTLLFSIFEMDLAHKGINSKVPHYVILLLPISIRPLQFGLGFPDN